MLADQLTKENRGNKFFCPICGDELIPVIPKEDIIRHFRHKNNEAHGEPETPEHLEMKQIVRNVLENNGNSADVEVKIGDNVADVLAAKLNLVIECQCSGISISEYAKRNTTYRDNGCVCLWILGGQFYEHTWEFKEQKDYKIQRFKKIELKISMSQPLIYFGRHNFWQSDLKQRYGAETLGWYNLNRLPLAEFVNIVVKTGRENM
jgi:competence CoiA-like predicted nuclease